MKPVSSVGAQYEIAIAREILQGTRVQGEQALALIETASAAPPPVAAAQGSLGRRIDVKA